MFSIGTVGCNWRCLDRQNAEISQEREVVGRSLPPHAAVTQAKRFGCSGVTFTYNEPSIFAEYALDVIVEAHKAGLFANFVTNGYMTPEAVGMIGPHLDAVSVDFKGSGEPGFLTEGRFREGARTDFRIGRRPEEAGGARGGDQPDRARGW